MVMFAEYANASVRTVNSGQAIISFLKYFLAISRKVLICCVVVFILLGNVLELNSFGLYSRQ